MDTFYGNIIILKVIMPVIPSNRRRIDVSLEDKIKIIPESGMVHKPTFEVKIGQIIISNYLM